MLLVLVALISSAAPVTIERKHTVGQRYRLTFTNADTQLKVSKTFKGTATVSEVKGGSTRFAVVLDELAWTNEQGQTRTAGGVKLDVEASAGSIDAEVTEPGTAGAAAQLELTSIEKMLGDLCQPPVAKLMVGKPSTLEGATWVLLSSTAGVAKLKSVPPKEGSPFTCELMFHHHHLAALRVLQLHVHHAGPLARIAVGQGHGRSTLKIELVK